MWYPQKWKVGLRGPKSRSQSSSVCLCNSRPDMKHVWYAKKRRKDPRKFGTTSEVPKKETKKGLPKLESHNCVSGSRSPRNVVGPKRVHHRANSCIYAPGHSNRINITYPTSFFRLNMYCQWQPSPQWVRTVLTVFIQNTPLKITSGVTVKS